MYDAKQYRTCLQQIGRVLQLRGDAARPYDPASLQLLRGECLVQLQDRSTAMLAFSTAEKSPDLQQAAQARAMSLLLSRSPGFIYTPKAAADARAAADASNAEGLGNPALWRYVPGVPSKPVPQRVDVPNAMECKANSRSSGDDFFNPIYMTKSYNEDTDRASAFARGVPLK